MRLCKRKVLNAWSNTCPDWRFKSCLANHLAPEYKKHKQIANDYSTKRIYCVPKLLLPFSPATELYSPWPKCLEGLKVREWSCLPVKERKRWWEVVVTQLQKGYCQLQGCWQLVLNATYLNNKTLTHHWSSPPFPPIFKDSFISIAYRRKLEEVQLQQPSFIGKACLIPASQGPVST